VNTYSVIYVSVNADITVTVTAKEFLFEGGSVVFVDDTGQAVLSVPTTRQPVITRTAVGSA